MTDALTDLLFKEAEHRMQHWEKVSGCCNTITNFCWEARHTWVWIEIIETPLNFTTAHGRTCKCLHTQNDGISKWNLLKPIPPALSIQNLKKNMKMTSLLGCFLFQPTAKPNRPNSWKWQRCNSTPYIFHTTAELIEEIKVY